MTEPQAIALIQRAAADDFGNGNDTPISTIEARGTIQSWYRSAAYMGRGELAQAIDFLGRPSAIAVYLDAHTTLVNGGSK